MFSNGWLAGICGIPCVSSEGLSEPTSCTNGIIDMNAIALNQTIVKKIDKETSIWMNEWVD